MADLDALTRELTSQHAALVKAYEAEQQAEKIARNKLRVRKQALQAFRAKYGAVVKAIEAGITVED